jgi:hypothetical protein
MRAAYMEKEEAKKMKQKQRDRMSAKTGKMDIAYEVRRQFLLGHSTRCWGRPQNLGCHSATLHAPQPALNP